jgi:hypothetical protein
LAQWWAESGAGYGQVNEKLDPTGILHINIPKKKEKKKGKKKKKKTFIEKQEEPILQMACQ